MFLTHFFNPEIPGLGRCQSWDSGLAKTAEIPRFGIPGLQTLSSTQPIELVKFMRKPSHQVTKVWKHISLSFYVNFLDVYVEY